MGSRSSAWHAMAVGGMQGLVCRLARGVPRGRARPGDRVSGGPGGGASWSAEDDACWREAARLRREYPGWIVIWLASAGQYRAYRRLPRARRDTTLSAATPEELAAQMTEAERARAPGGGEG